MRFKPSTADWAAAEESFSAPEASVGDYIDEHPVAPTAPLQPKCGTAPLKLIRDITDRKPGTALRIRNTVGLNDPFVHGITLLHIACRLYTHHRAMGNAQAIAYYESVVEALLEAGADPLAEMQMSALSDIETPASICRGFMPRALRQRMLAEAAYGSRIDVGGSPLSSHVERRAPRRIHAVVGKRRCPRLRDTGTAWEVLDNRGRVLETMAYERDLRDKVRQAAYSYRRRRFAAGKHSRPRHRAAA